MSHKARRRPSWKKGPTPFYLELIDEKTGELMEKIKIKEGANLLRELIRKVGPIEAEKHLREELFRLAGMYEE